MYKNKMRMLKYIIISVVFLQSCSSDSVHEPDIDTDEMVAKINNEFLLLGPGIVKDYFDDGTISIFGYEEEKAIEIRFPKAVGTYNFENEEAIGELGIGEIFNFTEVTPWISYQAVSGFIIVDEITDLNVKGSFEFTTTTDINNIINTVTEGKFDMARTSQ